MSSEDDLVGGMDAQAAVWVVKHDGHGLSTAEQAAFDRWIADPVHEAAYRRHRSVWLRYQQTGARMPALPAPHARCHPASNGRPWPIMRRRRTAVAIAASLAVLALTQVGAFSIWLRADYATGAGERLLVNLSDGSVVTLDGRSAIAYDDSGRRRILRLLEGSAYFDIAPDQSRPFTVETGVGSVTALGTAFGIRERDDAAELAVTEHDVRVRTEAGRTAVVKEGEAASFGADRVSVPARADVAAATAWRQGRLIVVDRPLGEVVAEIGRQRRGYWTVRGDAAAIRVSGVYDLDHPLEAIDALEKTLNLRSLRLSDRVIVLSR